MTRNVDRCFVACVLALASVTTRAHAYSDPSGFASSPIDEGGGGGRWFTGSPADGYTCNVCHSGGNSPELTVQGLPIDGYIPGASYEVIINWPSTLRHLGASVEITDERGAGAGMFQLPQGPAMDTREQCAPEFGAGILATSMTEVPAPLSSLGALPARQVMNVADCGAQRLRFLWIAPTQPLGQLWLSGALVAADGMADVHGDGVTDFARPITVGGGEPIASTVGGCSVTTGNPIVGSAPWLLFAVAWLVRRRDRGRLRA